MSVAARRGGYENLRVEIFCHSLCSVARHVIISDQVRPIVEYSVRIAVDPEVTLTGTPQCRPTIAFACQLAKIASPNMPRKTFNPACVLEMRIHKGHHNSYRLGTTLRRMPTKFGAPNWQRLVERAESRRTCALLGAQP